MDELIALWQLQRPVRLTDERHTFVDKVDDKNKQ